MAIGKAGEPIEAPKAWRQASAAICRRGTARGSQTRTKDRSPGI
jgi:hypothetical protein